MKEPSKTINDLLNKRSKFSNINWLKDMATEIADKKDISNAMNNFYCLVGKNLAYKISPVPNHFLSSDYEVNKDKTKLSFRTIGVEEIRVAIAKIKTAKSSWIDNISSFFLKLALPFIENSLAFNTSLETSNSPDLRKVARVNLSFQSP